MTDLATRIPLVEQQHRVSETERNAKIASTYVSISQSSYLSHALHPTGMLTMMTTQKDPSIAQAIETIHAERDRHTFSEEHDVNQEPSTTTSTPTPISYVHAGGFRYQIRRPVESWKFVETRKLDGSVIFLCRFCGSSYKHKKSLNKHWKDKHADVPRPQGAQADDDDDDEDEEEEEEEDEGDYINGDHDSDAENIPPNNSTLLCTTTVTHPATYVDPMNATTYSYSVTGGKPHESSQRVALTERAALRRLSAPIARSTNRPYHPRRTSFLPEAVTSTNMPLKRRFRDTVDSSPNRLNATHPRIGLSELPNENLQEPNVKRRQSILNPDEMLHAHESGTTQLIMNGTMPTDYTQLQQHYSLDPANHTIVRSAIPDSQPLDLSILRPSDSSPVPIQSAQSDMIHTNEHSTKSEQAIDISLLIGLLQTALNTLTAEFREASKKATEGSVSTSSLSKTSASLLLAVGTLLVSVVDQAKERKDTGKSLSPMKKEEQPIAEQNRAPQRAAVLSACHTPPNSQVLPPAPSLALISPAIEANQFPLEETKTYSDKNHSYALCQPDLTGTPPSGSIHYTEIQQSATPKMYQGLASMEASTVLHQTFTPIRYSRTHNKSLPAMGTSRTQTTDGISRSTRQTDESKLSGEGQSECQIICPVCNFDARWFSELRAHMVNHSEHRMFGCCYCTYRAKWKWDVAKHMRRCPLGRHVAHLSNEALLRIVRYHPPSKGNILFNYFPQDGFPGVGLDRPPTPPNSASNDLILGRGEKATTFARFVPTTSHSNRTAKESANRTNPPTRDHSPTEEPPLLTRQESVSPEMDKHATASLDQSPNRLIIVDEVGTTAQRPSVLEPRSDSNKAVLFRPQMMDSQDNSEAPQSGLVFKLRKCMHCTFHCIDEREYLQHVQSHQPSAGSSDVQTRPVISVPSKGIALHTS